MRGYQTSSRVVVRALAVCAVFLLVLQLQTATAATFWWNKTGNVSNDFNAAGNWDKTGGTTPVWGDQAFMTNAPSVNQTNIAYLNSGNGGFDVLVISNRAGAAHGINMVLVNGTFLQGDFVRIGTNGMITVNGGSMTWWRGGTLGSGGTIVLNNSSFNYGGQIEANFQFSGTIVGNNGTVAGTASGGDDAFRILSGGRVIANSGTLYFNPNDAFDHDGLTIDAGGVLQINSGATFVLNRTANAWNNDSPPDNAGTILLNGGTITMHFAGAQATDRGIQNTGTIMGSGTLAMRVAQSSSGQTIASNGVLNLFQTIAGNQQTFTSDGGGFGTFKAVSGGTLKLNGNVASGMGGAWIVDNGGTLEVAGVNVDLGAAFIPGGNLNGTVKVTTGGNFTLASATAGGPTLQQNGTFEFNASSGSANIYMPNVTGLAAFTNAGTILLTGNSSGTATFQTGFGSGGQNYGVVNTGTILATSGGSLTFRPENAFFRAFSNAPTGTIIVSNGTHFTIHRTPEAWAAGNTNVVNSGTILLNNGTVVTRDGGGNAGTHTFRNAGTIMVMANSTNFWRNSLVNAGTLAITNNGRFNQSGSFTHNTSAGLITNNGGRVEISNILSNEGRIVIVNGGILTNIGTVFLNSAGGVISTMRVDGASSQIRAMNGVRIGTSGSDASVLEIAGGIFQVATNDLIVGAAGHGRVVQSGGAASLNSEGGLYLGSNSVSVGTYTISGGSLFIGGTLRVGEGGVGVFEQTGGDVSVNNQYLTRIGNLAGSRGTYTLSGGTFSNTAALNVGYDGGGLFIQSGGTVTVLNGYNLNVGLNAGSTGIYRYAGGTIDMVGGGTFTFGSGRAQFQLSNNVTFASGIGGLSGRGISNDGAIRNIHGTNTFASGVDLTTTGTGSISFQADANTRLTMSGTFFNGFNGTMIFQGAGEGIISGSILAGGGSGSDSVIVSNTGGFWRFANNANNWQGGTTVKTGVAEVVVNQGLATFGVTIQNGGTVRVTNDVTIANTMTVTGRGFNDLGAIRSIAGSNTFTGVIDFNANTQINALHVDAGSTLTFNNALQNGAAGQTLLLQGTGGKGVINGSIMAGGAATAVVVSNNTGTWEFNSGANYYSGGTTIKEGTLRVTGNIGNVPTITIQELGTLNYVPAWTHTNVTYMQGGTIVGGTITNTGTMTGVGLIVPQVVNSGTIMAANPVGTLNMFSVSLSDVTSGTIGASNSATLNVVISGGTGSSFNNSGTIAMLGGHLIISNAAPGVITNNNFIIGSGSLGPSIQNQAAGTVRATNGVLALGTTANAYVENRGLMDVAAGATLSNAPSGWLNTNGTVQMAGGTLSGGTVTNKGTITGRGTVMAALVNASDGTVRATNGNLFLRATTITQNGTMIGGTDAGTVVVITNLNTDFVNRGTMILDSPTGDTTNVAFKVLAGVGGSSGAFSNAAGGVIRGAGFLLTGDGISGGTNMAIHNYGTMIATNGALILQPLDAFRAGGFVNEAGGTVIVANAASTFGIQRTANAWDNSTTNPVNSGSMLINGGTVLFYTSGLAERGDEALSNSVSGVISGHGRFQPGLLNLGTVVATNGNLIMDNRVVTPINLGTLQVANAATMTFNTSNAWVNAGEIVMRGGTLRTGGHTNAFFGESFTNLVTATIRGHGTIIGGGAFGGSGTGFDKAFINAGHVIASNGLLAINTGFATTNRGLANLGTMIVQGPTDTLALLRTAEITGAPFYVTNLNYLYNSGRIFINGGTLTANTSITNAFESVSLPGLIQGYGRIALTNEIVNLGTIRSTNGVLQFINSQPGDTDIVEIRQNGTLVVEGGSEMIVGTASNSVLVNNGTILMRGGVFRSADLTNSLGALFRGHGTITSPIINFGTGLATSASVPLHLTGTKVENRSGGVLGASNGILIVDAVFTNAGTVTFRNSLGTFNSAVVNQGAWTMNPSTNVFFGDYTVTSNGYLTMAAQSVNIFKSNFYNRSYMSNQYDTLGGRFVFDGTGGHTQSFYVAGINLGGATSSLQPSNEIYFTHMGGTYSTNSFLFYRADPIYGFTNNFALSSLEIGSLNTTSTLVLIDTRGTLEPSDGSKAGLYVHSFTIAPGSLLIISNNVEFYFMSSNGVSGVSLGSLNPGDNVLILDGGSFHQLVVIPEPSVLLLLTVGVGAIAWHRRRRR